MPKNNDLLGLRAATEDRPRIINEGLLDESISINWTASIGELQKSSLPLGCLLSTWSER